MTDTTSFDSQTLTVSSLTDGEKTGNGIFDELMRSLKSHLAGEHKAGRITGDQYTKAYIASLDSALAQSVQYALQYELTNQNVKLIAEQVKAAVLNVTLVQEQIDKLKAETALLEEQLVQTRAQTALIEQQTINAGEEFNVIQNTAAKVQSETDVLTQKRITEEYQTMDTVNGEVAGGIVGKQMALYENQAEGYIRDAEQKAAKLFMDSFNTRTSIESLNENETLDATVTGIQIKDLLNKVREGVNVTPQL